MKFYQNADPGSKNTMAKSEKEVDQNSVKWSDITTNPGRKAMIISIFLTCLCNFSGISAILNYNATIFRETGSLISPNTSTGIILVIGSLTVNFLVDRSGRKVTPFSFHQPYSSMVIVTNK